jgi:hypothetical protein
MAQWTFASRKRAALRAAHLRYHLARAELLTSVQLQVTQNYAVMDRRLGSRRFINDGPQLGSITAPNEMLTVSMMHTIAYDLSS